MQKILDQPQFADCVPGKSSEKTVIQVHTRGHKGVDQLLARVPVEEPPNLASVPNVIAD